VAAAARDFSEVRSAATFSGRRLPVGVLDEPPISAQSVTRILRLLGIGPTCAASIPSVDRGRARAGHHRALEIPRSFALFVTHLFDDLEQEHRALLERRRAHRRSRSSASSSDSSALGIRVEARSAGQASSDGPDRGSVFGRGLLPLRDAVQIVDGEVHRDPREPGSQRAADLEPPEVAIGADERVLVMSSATSWRRVMRIATA
jgi:hypothetical protein